MEWAGVELADGFFVAAAAGGAEIPADAFRASRRCGCKVAAAIPAESVFFETIDLPPQARRAPGKYLNGLLDVKLPVDVEACKTVFHETAPGTFCAFAVRRDDYIRFVDAFRAAAGCAPELVLPFPLVLWHASLNAVGPMDDSPVLFLDAVGPSWTLLGGTGANLRAVASVAGGDLAAVRRNLAIMARTLGASDAKVVVFGAADALAVELREAVPGAEISIRERPKTFVASALAALGKSCHGRSGGFASGEDEHPALSRRIARRRYACLALPVLAAFLLLAAAAVCKVRSAAARRSAEAEIGRIADRLAGRRMGMRGSAATLAMALNEFDARVDSTVRRFAAGEPLGALRTLFAFAASRNMQVASLVFDGQTLEVLLRAESENDVGALRASLAAEDFAVSSEEMDGGTWKMTVSVGAAAPGKGDGNG
jgi:hypothetical protein